MKNRIWKRCQLLIALGGFGFALGCASEPGPANASAESLHRGLTNQVESALAEVTSEPLQTVPPTPINTSLGVSEVIKLVQGGVDESVIMVYIENSDNFGELSTDEVTYLRDVGVDSKLITAMIRRGHALQNQAAAQATQQPMEQVTTDSTESVSAPVAAVPASSPSTQFVTVPPAMESDPNASSTSIVVETDPVVVQQPEQPVTVDYFQETLSPYGTWVELPDYGWTWRPTVAVVDPFWRPYHHGGRWLYTDYGWYWQSDYSWGWAPFHYGRWFRHHHYGWMWYPDTVWGPSWVSWRRTPLYCGWAPLPPYTYYRHGYQGYGLYYHDAWISPTFSFGFSYHYYTYIPYRNFCDRYPHTHYLSASHARDVHKDSKVSNHYFRGPDNRVINQGVDPKHVASLSRNEIKTVAVRDLPPGQGKHVKPDRIERQGDQAVIYRPHPQAAPASVATPLVNKNRQELRNTAVSTGREVESSGGPPTPLESARRPALSTAGARSVAPASPFPSAESSRITRSSNQGVPITRIEPRAAPGNNIERRSTAPLAADAAPARAVPRSATPSSPRAIESPTAPTPVIQPNHWSQALGQRPAESRPQPVVSTPQSVQTPSASMMQSTPRTSSSAARSPAWPMENRTVVQPSTTPAPIGRPLQEQPSSRVFVAPSSSSGPATPAFPSRSERLSSPTYAPRAVTPPSVSSSPAVSAPRSFPAPSYERPTIVTPRTAITPSAPSIPTPSLRMAAPPVSAPRPVATPPSPSVNIRSGPMSGESAPRPAPTPAPASSAGSDSRRGERSSNR